MKYWLLAARPKTLIAGLIPVFIGTAYASHYQSFKWHLFIAILFAVICIQIATNFINDAADFESGADNEDRLGPARMANSGFLSPKSLYRAAFALLSLSFFAGLYVVSFSGWPLFLLGLSSILLAYLYTAGPYPLAYYGLGDVFVFVFFGLVATAGTVYAYTEIFSTKALLLGACTGLQGTALICINNLRDIPTDTKSGKKTFSVFLGETNSKIYYTLLTIIPFIIWIFVWLDKSNLLSILPLLSLPLGILNITYCFLITDRKKFNSLLGFTSLIQALFGLGISLYFLYL
ncbi:MAG: 1,4-dihydroxy-2-naphthoate polyprenyltransferase [Oligoflexia bacterium]|nr:1,4-dihydroxy-2-naphthoate polyprenyltransferase [Oligoflexia bacterium]